MEQVNLNIQNYVEYMESISQVVINNRDMKEYLFGQSDREVTANLIEQFQTLLKARKDIFNIAIIGYNGKYLINDGEGKLNPGAYLDRKEWYQEAKRQVQTLRYPLRMFRIWCRGSTVGWSH